jgi:hypothetical protein
VGLQKLASETEMRKISKKEIILFPPNYQKHIHDVVDKVQIWEFPQRKY